MLTSIFYYNYYKPYMLKVQNKGAVTAVKRPKIAEKSSSDNYKVLLNKSLKTDVVSYAKDVSSSVVGTKDSAKNLVRDMEDFNKNIYKRDLNTAKKWIADDLEDFVQSYNKSTSFLSSQQHSQSLQGFAERLTDNVSFNIDSLNSLGVSMDEDGKLAFDSKTLDNLDQSAVNNAIGENMNLFQSIYNDAGDMLQEPLTEHMKFKGLGYYYNYKFGTMESDTFRMIESGMLVDKVV